MYFFFIEKKDLLPLRFFKFYYLELVYVGNKNNAV